MQLVNISKVIDKCHKKQTLILNLVTLIIFLMILLLNCLTPMAADDYAYSFVYSTNERINGIADIFRSQWIHYFNWGGRSVVHLIAQLFLWWGKPFFNVCNSMMFVIYISLISLFSFGKRSVNGILCSLFIAWFMLPVIGSVIFWLTGSCNYLWGTTIVFLFIYPYYNCILKANESRHGSLFLPPPLWFVFGIIAGWCNENTSGMGILVCCLLTLYKYKTHKKISLWQIVGILGSIVGFSFMILAPGNYARADAFNTPSNPLKRLFEGVIRADAKSFTAAGINGVLFFLFLFTYLFMVFTPISKDRKIIGGIWFIGALSCNYAMILAPYYPNRASFGVYSMYFISIFYAGRTLVEYFNKNIFIDISKALLCIGCLYFLIFYFEATYDIGIAYRRNNARVETVLSEKSMDNYDIVVPPIEPTTKYNVFSSVYDWPQYDVEKYFGVNSIKIIRE